MISSNLKADLSSPMPIEQVFQKHIVDGKSYYFQTIISNPDYEYQLRYDLAVALGVSINDVVIMGSAKLGFSVKTENFVGFDDKFSHSQRPGDRSDIDVAVVNRIFYDTTLREIYGLSRHFDPEWVQEKWKINAFYSEPSNLHKRYAQYLAKGWLRPDLMPLDYFQAAQWVRVRDEWSAKLDDRKISLGFYSDWYYLKHYQMDNLELLRTKIWNLGA
jgi:hypothetical protein